jgi:hypothetical protein
MGLDFSAAAAAAVRVRDLFFFLSFFLSFFSSLLFRRPTVFFCFVLLCFVRFLRFGVFGVCFVLCRFFPLSPAC